MKIMKHPFDDWTDDELDKKIVSLNRRKGKTIAQKALAIEKMRRLLFQKKTK